MIEVTMPQLGETMEEAEILTWLKAVGERVERGEPLLEVQTDKIAVEVPALASGILAEILAAPGVVVSVGAPIARLASDAPSIHTPVGADDSAPAEAGAKITEHPKLRASPAARRLSRELNIELSTLSGSGPNQRITTQDVRGASDAPTTYRFTRLEQATGRTTAAAFRDIPHFYLRIRAEVTGLMARLTQLRDGGEHATLNDLLVLACAGALRRHPRLNASVAQDGLTLHPEINIGVITATPAGLITAVVPRADTLPLQAVHERVAGIRARLQAGRAKATEVSGATFCISNLGMFGIDEFSAIILPPNVGILAVGAVQEDALVTAGALRFAKTLRLTLSADHRAIDGVTGALFLNDLRAMLETPTELLGAVNG
jgi:pyruvate dehydrogenase E2 component (dihydrolipoamide acetyltransferase)